MESQPMKVNAKTTKTY